MFGLKEKALHALTVCQRLNITQNIGLTQNSVYQPIKHFFQGQTAIVVLMTYRQTLWHLPVLLRAMPANRASNVECNTTHWCCGESNT